MDITESTCCEHISLVSMIKLGDGWANGLFILVVKLSHKF